MLTCARGIDVAFLVQLNNLLLLFKGEKLLNLYRFLQNGVDPAIHSLRITTIVLTMPEPQRV